MTVVDDRGRLFGRFNLIDVLVATVLLAVIPLGYGAYILFRTPQPRLTSVEPAQRQHEREFRIIVRGEHLRPYMRVSLNEMQGRAFLFKNDTSAEVVFGDVPPGTFDVILYDYAQERSRLPQAFTLAPAALPATQLDLAGFISGVNAEGVKQIVAGRKFGPSFEVLKVGTPAADLAQVMTGDKKIEVGIPSTYRVPVLLRVNCSVVSGNGGFGECLAGRIVAPSVYLDLPVENGHWPFLVIEAGSPAPRHSIDVDVRLSQGDPAASVLAVGDVDVGYSMNEFAGGGTVIRAGSGVFTVRLPAALTIGGWTYAGQPVRIGAPLLLVTKRYQVTGMITAVPPPPAP
jgi:hypothetical protein